MLNFHINIINKNRMSHDTILSTWSAATSVVHFIIYGPGHNLWINKFKCNTYFKCLDVTITFINNYFNAQAIGIYKDLAHLSKKKECLK